MSVLSQEAGVDHLDAGELLPALKAALLDGPAWRKVLVNFAQLTNLAVALVDVEGRLVIDCLNPRPTWSLLHSHSEPWPANWCPFALVPLAPCTCHADALTQETIITATNGAGLVHFAVPLVLEGHCLGALLAGQVFAQYPEQLAVEWMAEKLGLKPGKAWALARLEVPVKQATLRVYAGLLANLGQNFLENRFHQMTEEKRLAEMTRLRDHAVAETEERRRAEAELRASGERFRFMAESMPQKIFTAKPNGDVDYFNRIWMEFTGLSFEEIKDWGWRQFIHPDDLGESVRSWRHALDTNEPFQMEHRFRRADGFYRWHLTRALPLRDARGKVLMWIGSNTDMEDVKRAQETLLDENRRKNEFLAMLAHELRNPLAPILNALQIIRLSDQRELREQARQMLERQVRYMVRLIDDLLDVSRISQGKIELRLERVELATVVENAVETSRSIIEARSHELTVKLPSEPLWLDADPIRLAQVLANLLNNAAKYTPNGGRIAMTAEREGPETAEGSAIVRVSDTGVGMSAEMLPRVFELFTQADRSLDRAQGGLGIGLSVARSLLELHGGSLTASSEGPGQGSQFTVHLPLAAERHGDRPAERVEEIRAPSRGSAGLRVLVVDDNRDATESLSTLLHLMGHEVRCAYEGPTALIEAAVYDPDLVLLDIGLPGMSGLEVARHIREQPRLKHTVLTALTGWGTEEDRRRSHEAGFDHHLVKPFDSDSLEKLLASVGSSKE